MPPKARILVNQKTWKDSAVSQNSNHSIESNEFEKELDRLTSEKEALTARAVAAEEALSALKLQVEGRVQASTPRSHRFEPRVAVYDTQDASNGMRRIVRIEAPGRCLDGGDSATVSGEVESIANGVTIRLNKLADLPLDARFSEEWLVDDPVGSWEWKYTPTDGEWALCESWGFAHGIFAFAMQPVVADPAAQVQSPTPSASSPLSPKSPDGQKAFRCVAVIAPVSDSQRQLSYFQPETNFLHEDGRRVHIDDLICGMRIRGPQGSLEVLQVVRDSSKYREVASISMGKEALSVISGTKIAAYALTDFGAAEDLAYRDARQLQSGSHEVGVSTPGGPETTLPVNSLALLGQQASAVVMEVNDLGTDGAVFVVLEKSFQGHLYRSKRPECTHPNSDFISGGPFDYKAPQRHDRVAKQVFRGWK